MFVHKCKYKTEINLSIQIEKIKPQSPEVNLFIKSKVNTNK